MNIGEIVRNENGKVSGYIAEAGFDFDFFFRKVVSDNPDAPGFYLMTKSPRGRDVRLGAIWERVTRETGEVYFAGYIDTAQSGFVPIRIFQSRDNANVWTVVRHIPRRRRQEREVIDLPETAMQQPDATHTPTDDARQARRRAAPKADSGDLLAA